MKRAFTLFLSLVAAFTFGVAWVTTASAAPVSGHSLAVVSKRCSGDKIHWDTGVNYSVLGFHDYGEAHWTSNAHRCSWFKTQILCLDTQAGNSYYTKTSTVYRGVNVNDKLACDLDDDGERFSIDVNGTWKELCTRGGSPACRW